MKYRFASSFTYPLKPLTTFEALNTYFAVFYSTIYK